MASVQDFASVINSKGVHHNCYYDIDINIPLIVVNHINDLYGLSLSGTKLAEHLNTFCTEVNVPSMSVASAPIRVGGEQIEIPYDRLYGEFQTTFYVDNGNQSDGGLTLKTIQSWLDIVYPPFTRNFAYPDEYTTKITIKMYTLHGDKVDIVKLNVNQAWPSSIQAAQLSGRTGNEPTSFVVTWKYRYLMSEPMQQAVTTQSDVQAYIDSVYQTVDSSSNVPTTIKETPQSTKATSTTIVRTSVSGDINDVLYGDATINE